MVISGSVGVTDLPVVDEDNSIVVVKPGLQTELDLKYDTVIFALNHLISISRSDGISWDISLLLWANLSGDDLSDPTQRDTVCAGSLTVESTMGEAMEASPEGALSAIGCGVADSLTLSHLS